MPQGAEGLMRVASRRRDRAGLAAWFREGVAARYDSPSLHDRYVAFLRPAYGGSIGALVEHAWSCLDAANPGCFGDDAALERERSMLPYGGVLAFLAALDVSGEKPARFFGAAGVLGEICAALAPMLSPRGAGTGPGDYDATMHARFESAWFLAALLWTFEDEDGALQAFETVSGVPGYYCRRLQQSFPGTFDIYLSIAGLSGPNAGLVRPLYERLRAGDAEGYLAHWEEAFAGGPPERRETGLLERLAIRAFLAARFPGGESWRVPITPHREFSCWHGYGIGWQPEPDDEGGYAWFTGRQPYACFEFGLPLPTPLEIETSFELTPNPATNALFAIRLFPADLRFSNHRGESPEPASRSVRKRASPSASSVSRTASSPTSATTRRRRSTPPAPPSPRRPSRTAPSSSSTASTASSSASPSATPSPTRARIVRDKFDLQRLSSDCGADRICDMRRISAIFLIGATMLAVRASTSDGIPLSPSDMTSALERKIVSGVGVMYPGSDLESATTPALALLDAEWPDSFLDRIGETISVRVSSTTGYYEFTDESGSVFWIEIPVAPVDCLVVYRKHCTAKAVAEIRALRSAGKRVTARLMDTSAGKAYYEQYAVRHGIQNVEFFDE